MIAVWIMLEVEVTHKVTGEMVLVVDYIHFLLLGTLESHHFDWKSFHYFRITPHHALTFVLQPATIANYHQE